MCGVSRVFKERTTFIMVHISDVGQKLSSSGAPRRPKRVQRLTCLDQCALALHHVMNVFGHPCTVWQMEDNALDEERFRRSATEWSHSQQSLSAPHKNLKPEWRHDNLAERTATRNYHSHKPCGLIARYRPAIRPAQCLLSCAHQMPECEIVQPTLAR
jgi:hypothetical protein